MKQQLDIGGRRVTVFPQMEGEFLVGYKWVTEGQFSPHLFDTFESAVEDAEYEFDEEDMD